MSILHLMLKKLRKHLIYLLCIYTIVDLTQGLSHFMPASKSEADAQPNVTNEYTYCFNLT